MVLGAYCASPAEAACRGTALSGPPSARRATAAGRHGSTQLNAGRPRAADSRRCLAMIDSGASLARDTVLCPGSVQSRIRRLRRGTGLPGGSEAAMRLQPHRRNLLSNLPIAAGESRTRRPVRSWRLRRWLHTGALLSVLGIRRLARTRWQPLFLVTGTLVFVIGLIMRSSVAVVSGLLVIGSAAYDTALPSPTAATVRTWMWLRKSRTDDP
jgi:hypothetical protein